MAVGFTTTILPVRSVGESPRAAVRRPGIALGSPGQGSSPVPGDPPEKAHRERVGLAGPARGRERPAMDLPVPSPSGGRGGHDPRAAPARDAPRPPRGRRAGLAGRHRRRRTAGRRISGAPGPSGRVRAGGQRRLPLRRRDPAAACLFADAGPCPGPAALHRRHDGRRAPWDRHPDGDGHPRRARDRAGRCAATFPEGATLRAPMGGTARRRRALGFRPRIAAGDVHPEHLDRRGRGSPE